MSCRARWRARGETSKGRQAWSYPLGQIRGCCPFRAQEQALSRPKIRRTMLVEHLPRVGYLHAVTTRGHLYGDRDERAFRLLCETSGTGFWHIDVEGYTIYVNPAMCAMLQISSPADLLGQTYHRFFTEDSLRRVHAERDKRFNGLGSTYEVELVGLHGGHRNVVISGVPVTNEQGELIGRFGSLTDITEGKRAEGALRANENRLRSLFATSVDAIGVSSNGIHVMVNPAYVRMFGVQDARELEGTSILPLIAPCEREVVAGHVRQRTAGHNEITHYVTRGLRRDGREFPMEVHVSSYEENGAPHTVAILRDITDRLALEDELRQSQKMDALGRLAGGVAHDFNNLLTVILSCAELVLRDLPTDSRTADNVRNIKQTGERAATLTRQLLAISRRQVIEPKVIDVNTVVDEMAAMLRRLIGAHIPLTLDRAENLSPVRVDVGQFQQVIMNLCVNARDAMADGGQLVIRTRNVDIELRAAVPRAEQTAGRYVVVSVSDTGHGMSAEAQVRLFEPFFTTKNPGQGTGLGLSTAYGIVKQSGGYISVDTAVGQGTTFHVYLPVADILVGASPARATIEPVYRAGTVLLAEDEPMLRDLITRYLGRLGYEVLVASHGREALALFTEHRARIDVVVTDMLMPEVSGVELVREIDALAPGIRVLFMSGYAFDGASILTARPGSAFIAKPFTLPDLTERVATLLAERPGPARDG